MTEDEDIHRHIDPVRDAMRQLVEVGSALRADRKSIPAADSQGMAELNAEHKFKGTGEWSSEPVHTAYSWAGVLLLCAEDGMLCIDRLFAADRLPIFGHLVQARAVLENSARARWLLEARVGVKGRVERWLANRVEDLTHLNGLDLPTEPGKTSAVEKLDALLDEAEGRGFARRTKKGNLELIEELPGYRRLVEDLFDSSEFSKGLPRIIYSYYSAIAHGQVFGLLESMDRDQAIVDNLGGSAMVPFVIRSDGLVGTMAIVISAYTEVIDEQIRLFGWPHSDWLAARLEALRAVKDALPVDLSG